MNYSCYNIGDIHTYAEIWINNQDQGLILKPWLIGQFMAWCDLSRHMITACYFIITKHMGYIHNQEPRARSYVILILKDPKMIHAQKDNVFSNVT